MRVDRTQLGDQRIGGVGTKESCIDFLHSRFHSLGFAMGLEPVRFENMWVKAEGFIDRMRGLWFGDRACYRAVSYGWRDPKHQPLAELRKEWKKSINDQGFADAFDYMKHLREQDPAMCRIIYKSYNECISKGYDDCERYREYNCPQFK
uniref:Uncharacterized protein n=1 Tax=Quercus lobata TaxID=97700 RepID=A0A7N2KPQ5_QUELO